MNPRNEENSVTIVCQDGKIRAQRSALTPYRSLYEARSTFAGALNEIKLPYLSVEVVRQIVSWAERHMKDKRTAYEPNQNVTVTLTPEDENHLRSLDIVTLFEVIQAADEHILLDLLDGACQAAARALEEADPMDIRREFFGGESGFTELEEEQLRKENEWIEEL